MNHKDSDENNSIVLLRGGGDLASGVALRLHRVGIKVLITEVEQPLAVRRLVAFSEAIYQGSVNIEKLTARHIQNPKAALRVIATGEIPVIIDPDCESLHTPEFDVIALVDARMTKLPPDIGRDAAPMVIGLGPGFIAGENCHAVVETNRGHFLGRVIWEGPAEPNTGIPGKVGSKQVNRVLRAPTDGILRTKFRIGEPVKTGDILADVSGEPVVASFDGILRGMLPDAFVVHVGMKIGDLDPRNDASYAVTVSDKSLAIGGGALEALLTRPEIRSRLWI
jgi:xanthine dehydrogenase accessory factor